MDVSWVWSCSLKLYEKRKYKYVWEFQTKNSLKSVLKTSLDPDTKINNTSIWHVTSALMGCYSLACVVLIKMMLPERFSIAFSMALDEVSIFTFHTRAINAVFFFSAVVSATTLAILLMIQRQNIAKHADILSQRRSSIKGAFLPDV